MTMAIAIKKLQRNLNDVGLRETCRKGLQYLLKAFYVKRTYRIYRRDLCTWQGPESAPEGVVFKVVEAGDARVISQIEDMEEWLHGKLATHLSHGLCVAAHDGPTVVGFNLIGFIDVFVPLLNLRKRLRPHQAWSEQITVLKTYRKQGLASALRYRVFTELRQRGVRSLYGGALITNIPSLKSAEKTGFQFVADVQYLKILNWEGRTYRRIRHVNH